MDPEALAAFIKEHAALFDLIRALDATAFREALHEAAPDFYQSIFGTGYGTSKAEFTNTEKTGKLDKALAEVDVLKTRVADLEKKLRDVPTDDPEATATINTLKQQLAAKEQEIEDLTTKVTELENAGESLALGDAAKAFLDQVIDHLVDEHDVVRKYAEDVEGPTWLKRISATRNGEETPVVEALDANGAPLAATTGKPLHVRFAEDVVKTVDDFYIRSGGSGGGGTGTGRKRKEKRPATTEEVTTKKQGERQYTM